MRISVGGKPLLSFFRRRPKLPEFTPAMSTVLSETLAGCRAQLAALHGAPCRFVPAFGGPHEQRIASYACGFVEGRLEGNRADLAWAAGRRGIAGVGRFMLEIYTIKELFGVERLDALVAALPQFSGDRLEGRLELMHARGRLDGLALRPGAPAGEDGFLSAYLREHLTRAPAAP